jgi:hypothetical protein
MALWGWHAGCYKKKTGQHNKKTSFKAVIIIKNVLIEFGYPAFLDLLLVRFSCIGCLYLPATR